MYIAGEIHSFTEKGHHYYSGEKLCKSIALCNDERSKQEYQLSFEIVVNGKTIADGRLTGSVPVGESILLPLETELPETAARTSGVIRVKGKFGKGDVFDEFHFSVYPAIREKMANEVLLFDPRAAVRRDFLRLNISFREWKGEAAAGNVLVVAQGALNEPLPGALDGFVRSGGRLLILGQTGDVLMDAGKFRISRHVSRRFWPVATQRNHPILSGIDAGELCNWRGAGTLLPEESGTSIAWPKASLPFGWHVSNQGSVASIAVAADPRQAIKAIVEAESYDGPSLVINYSPCMQHGMPASTGMSCMAQEAEKAVSSGYWPLYRYDPRRAEKGDNPFQLDFKKIKTDVGDFLKGENRFTTLDKSLPDVATQLHATLKQQLIERHEDRVRMAMSDKQLYKYLQKKFEKK